MPIPQRKPMNPDKFKINLEKPNKKFQRATPYDDEDFEEDDGIERNIKEFNIDDDTKDGVESYDDDQDECEDESKDEDEDEKAVPALPIQKAKHPIWYSSIAKHDGYDFSSLTKEEQEMSRYLYTSEDGLSDFYKADRRVSENSSGSNRFNFSVKVPCSGWYYGYVYEYKKSDNNPNFRVLKLLIDYDNIKSFSFPSNTTNAAYATIKKEKGIEENIFRQANYSVLEGCLVLVKVENKTINGTDVFSEIVNLRFISNEEYDVLIKMVNLMLKQSGH